MTRPRWILTCAALSAIPSFGFAQTIVDSSVTLTTHASGFSLPTGIEFLGGSPTDFFIIEKNTGLVKRSNNGVVTTALDLAVSNASERGLLGIAKSPSFATDNLVYLYYSRTLGADGGAWDANVLSRYTWNGTNLIPDATFTTKTFGTAADGQAQGPNHDAGPIAFGPDGKLYGMTGDLNRNVAEQNNTASPNTSSKVGGIYRFNPDGSLPSDNPFIGNSNTEFRQWYGYGVRNSFGLTFDPLTGAAWDTENGPTEYDEINMISPGFNSGWNKIMGPDSRDPQNVSDLVSLPGSAYSDPEFSWSTPVAPTGLTFLANSLLDLNYRDAVLVGDNNFGQLYLYRLNANRDGFVLSVPLADLVADWTGGNTTERDLNRFGQSFGAVTEFTVGPDGGVYITGIGTGNIYRLGGKSWKLDANGTWDPSTPGNWQGGVPGSNEFANFFGTISAPRTVTLPSTKFVAGVVFNSPFRYTLAKPMPNATVPFILTSSTGTAYLRVLGGSHTIDLEVTLNNNTIVDVLPANSVMTITGRMFGNSSPLNVTKNGAGTIETSALVRGFPQFAMNLVINAGTFKIIPNGTNTGTSIFTTLTVNGGKFDITDNDMVLTGTTRAAVEALVKSGFGNSDWLGTGITSSTAATFAQTDDSRAVGVIDNADWGYATFGGQAVSSTDILVKYTWMGDANVDGLVDNDDFGQFLYGFNGGGAARWLNGDFNFSGTVDNDDFGNFLTGLNAFHASGNVQLSEEFRSQLAEFASANGVPLLLPEPSALATLGVLGLLARRRRNG